MSRDFHLPGRSPVIAGEAMAATSHPLATLAAIDVLRLGGNAVDAAVTAVAVLCVIEPHMTGIGGDCFALIAEDGKPVWGYNGCGRSGATRDYRFNGRAPEEGDIVKVPALAATLKAIAKDGPRAFYEGPIAEDMASTLAALGSVLTAEDFARHRGEAVTPISTNYRGVDLVEIPPNTQGLTALVTLNIL